MSDRGTVQIPLLSPIIMGEGEACRQINHTVRWTDRLTDACRCRMEQLEKIHRWLAGYVQAVGIMLQIPGAAEYRFAECAGDEHLWDLIWNTDTASTLNVLAAALKRLDADHLLRQTPGGEDFRPDPLPVEAQVALAERDRNGLLNVVADCLDRILVTPNIPGELDLIGLTPARRLRHDNGHAGKRHVKRKEKRESASRAFR
jgi:hypothetical protein